MKKWLCLLVLALSAAFAHADSPDFELKGSVAFAPTPAQFLLAYTSNEVSSGPNIYAKVLGADGTPTGPDVRLNTLDGQMSKPAIAYSAKQKRFLVVWGRKLFTEGRAEVWGMSVGLNGKVYGPEFRIAFSNLYDTRPALNYSPTQDRFLVTWTRGTSYDYDTGISDIYGQFVSGDATKVLGSNFAISSADRNQFKSDVSYDAIHDRFLVVWEDQRNAGTQDDAYGQFIGADGTAVGSNFPISGTTDIERRPVAAGNSTDGTFLVVWETVVADVSTINCRLMDSNGNFVGPVVAVGAEIGGKRNRPAVAYLKKQNVYAIVFYNSNDTEFDAIYAQLVEANGSLRNRPFALTNSRGTQNRPDITTTQNAFMTVWTDTRDAQFPNGTHDVYEYYGRLFGNDMALSSRWKNPESK